MFRNQACSSSMVLGASSLVNASCSYATYVPCRTPWVITALAMLRYACGIWILESCCLLRRHIRESVEWVGWDVREGGWLGICWMMYKVFGRLCARGDGVLLVIEGSRWMGFWGWQPGERFWNFTVVLLLSRLIVCIQLGWSPYIETE